MFYRHIFPTSFGYAGILFQTRPFLVKRILLPHWNKAGLLARTASCSEKKRAGFTQDLSPCPKEEVPWECLRLSANIQAYFRGKPIKTNWTFLDITGLTPLQHSVLEAVADVAYGEVKTYSEIAAEIGRPRAARFVGTTLASNPFPVLIPCHRIIRADGSAGGFSGGTNLKERLLTLERRLFCTHRRPCSGLQHRVE
ncbi:MAG: methylated-DNA--[protein]-cysteine S-methyltransferase [Deltaproteobacteria bacterium]|nr:methylated-DNA--[protein]-cysteine S-methyltransferase [Deltaproteobacteria bacterium]